MEHCIQQKGCRTKGLATLRKRFLRNNLLPQIILPLLFVPTCIGNAQQPEATIRNGVITAKLYLPDRQNGFYRGTRFDWSGIIASLEYAGHNYYGPWFTKTSPTVHDFIYDGPDIVTGPASSITGPSEEFFTNDKGLGFDDAAPGATFLKIGVGVLRRPDAGKYDQFHSYELVDPGKWHVSVKPQSVEFTQQVMDPASGYGYLYKKTVRLVPGKPQMLIEHSLKNIGKRPIDSSVYDHNFLVLDKQPISPDFVVTLPFDIQPTRPIKSTVGAVEKNRITYRKQLEEKDRFATAFTGFGPTSKDYDITIENQKVGVGMNIKGDRPLESEELWSIRSILAMEPFIHMSIKPGETFQWKYTYLYYTLPHGKVLE
jgi:hypothetical protein